MLTVSSVEVDVDLQAMDWLDREVGHTATIEPLIGRVASSAIARFSRAEVYLPATDQRARRCCLAGCFLQVGPQWMQGLRRLEGSSEGSEQQLEPGAALTIKSFDRTALEPIATTLTDLAAQHDVRRYAQGGRRIWACRRWLE